MIEKIFSFGITETTPPAKAKRIRTINTLATFSFLIMLITDIAAVLGENYFVLYTNFFRFFVFLGLFTFILFKKHNGAAYYFMISSFLLNSYSGYVNPQQNVMLLTIFPIVALSIYLINNLRWNIVYAAANCISFITLRYRQDHQNLNFNITMQVGIVIIFAAFVLIYYFIKKENENYEKLIQVQNEKLALNNKLLEEQNENLSSLNNLKDKFFKIIAHDLRNPFQGINAISDLMIKEYDTIPDSDKINFIEKIKSTSNSGYYLLDNLLKWSISQTTELHVKKEICFPYHIITETLLLFHEQIASKNINFVNNIPFTLQIMVDKNMFASIIRNLISNALKFTPKDGKVSINSRVSTEKVFISIHDSGIGLSSNQIADIMNHSNIISTPGTTNEQGTGIGLYLCNEFIHKHGGNLVIESILGKGSTFSFDIPN